MKNRRNNKPVIVLLAVLIVVGMLLGGMIWFLNSHFFVEKKAYPKNAEELDLRDRKISVETYEKIREQLPDCEIRWNVPFQTTSYDDDTTSLTVSALSEEDLRVLEYFTELKELDARGSRDYRQIQNLMAQRPDVKVRYTVVIDGKEYAEDAEAVICSTLTDEDIAMMALLPELKAVDTTGCSDHKRLAALTEAIPGLEVTYQVEVLGKTFTEQDTSATFKKADLNQLLEQLAAVPHLETVKLTEPKGDGETLRKLLETYPDISFTWKKTVLDKTFSSTDKEIDLSDTGIVTVVPPAWGHPLDAGETKKITETVREAMAWFPHAEKVILPAVAFENETMAAFREEMRSDYKVVWTVFVTKKPVRTDQEVIHSSAYQVCFIDEQSQDLKYCEDAIVVDIGHSYVKNIEWVKGMPKLKYLILAHNWIKDLSPISTCKNLEYLEIFWNEHIPDYTPLLGCTALKDLNLSGTYADLDPLMEMTWVENLWANCCGITEGEYNDLREALPNTHIEYRGGDYTSYGWREVQGYYDMRDFMGLPYNHW